MVYPISKFWIYPIWRIFIKKVSGMDNIPKKFNFIVISNHENRIDPFYLIYPIMKKLNKKIHFLAQPKLWFLGEKFCRHWAGCIPLFSPKQAYKEIKEYLKKGKIIGIFPQGDYKTQNKNIFKTGVIRIATETKTPILPVGIKSSYIPLNSKLNIGKLIYLNKNNKNFENQTTDLMKQVYKLRDDIV